jgi:nicotinate-nucleotide adenylyltransferase
LSGIDSIGNPRILRRPAAAGRLVDLIRERLSAERQRHSLAVARLSGILCQRYGADPDRGLLSGLGHDIARELPAQRILALAAMDGRPIGPMERERPVLLHGRAGAVLLAQEAGIDDPQVLEAIRDHTVGRPGMGLLPRLLYAADYLEPTRSFASEEFRREALRQDLDTMLLRVVEQVFEYLRREGIPSAPEGEAFYRELQERIQRAQA